LFALLGEQQRVNLTATELQWLMAIKMTRAL